MENSSWHEKFLSLSKSEQEEMVNTDNKWIEKLIKWAAHIRGLFDQETMQEVITTRSLINIVQAYGIYDDKSYAIQLACDRFDKAHSTSFQDLYQKMSDDTWKPEPPKEEPKTDKTYFEF